jgi:hypothetical protein
MPGQLQHMFVLGRPCHYRCARASHAKTNRCTLDLMQGAYQTYTDQPDCPGYQDLLRRHALQLVAAGVDHVLVLMHIDKRLQVTQGI